MNYTLSNVKKNRKKEEIVFYKCETKKGKPDYPV